MSTIIECPACTTRYKMNKAIPEGGRYVKCARCGNQWRLVPEGVVEETIEADEPEHNPVAEASHEAADEAPAAEAHQEDEEQQQPFAYGRRQERAAAADADAALPAWQTRRETLGAAISGLSEPPAETDEDVAPEEEADADADEDTRWHGFEDSAESDEAPEEAPAEEADEPRIPAFASRFDAALHGHAEPEPEDDADPEPVAPVHAAAPAPADDDAGLSWAQRMSRPWRDITAAIPPEPEPEAADVDTETSIREALRAALEQPEPPAEPRVRSTFNWDTYGAKEVPEEVAATSDVEPEQDYPPFRIPGHDPHAEPSDDEDPPFRMSGAAARRPVYDQERDEDEDDASPREDSAFQHDIEDAFRSGSMPKKPLDPSRGKQRHDEPLTDFDSIYDDQAMRVPGDVAAGADGYDADTAALQAELESNTDLTEYAPARSGGLAVAAGWAMFLSIISGLALGAVSFRQEIMTALPGTTSLYSAIGFSVANAGVDFADVTYRWTTAEGKPMIEVKGQVINVTNRTVTVPRVLINVRDANSSDSVKATASVPTDTLAPRESAAFTLEFLSPPKNISQIELEFDQNP